ERQPVPFAQVIEYARRKAKHKAEAQERSAPRRKPGKKRYPRGGNGMGEIVPLRGRHLRFLTGVVLGTEAMPDDTLGCWVAPALRHLMLVDGCSGGDALAVTESYLRRIPDVRFSDRLSAGDVDEVLRTAAYLARKIAAGNLYQDRPEESSAIFEKVGAHCRRIGFVFADPSTWHVLDPRPCA